MGNMFFNIGQLTNYLIGDSAKVTDPKPVSSESVDFDSFVQSLMNNGDSSKLGKGINSPEDLKELFAEFITSKEASHSISSSLNNTKQAKSTYTDKPISDDELLGLLNPVSAGAVNQSLNPEAKNQAMASEVFEVVELKVDDLKNHIVSQPVAVKQTLTLKQPLNELNQLNTIQSNDYNSAVSEKANNANSSEINKSSNGIDLKSLFGSTGKQDITTLEFDARELFNNLSSKVSVKATDQNNNSQSFKVDTSELKALIKDNSESSLVELQANEKAGIKNSAQSINRSSVGITYQALTDEKIVLDIKSLVSAKDSENVKVVVKTVNPEPERVSTVNLLNELNIKSHDNFKLRGNDLAREFAINDLAQSSKAVKQSSETADDYDSQNNNDNSKSGNAVKPNTQQAPVVVKQTANNAQTNNIENTNHNLNAIDQTGGKEVIKTSTVLAENEVNLPRDNSELIENVTNQLRSRLTTGTHGTRLTIALKPETLGKINIEFYYDKDKLEAVFRVDNGDVKAILDSELPRLKNEFKIDTYRVETNMHDFKDESHAQNGKNRFDNMAENNKPYRNSDKIDDENSAGHDTNDPKNNKSNTMTGIIHGRSVDLLA